MLTLIILIFYILRFPVYGLDKCLLPQATLFSKIDHGALEGVHIG
jgi:hypothetical protein